MLTLNESLEALYAAFADVKKPSFIEGCPCCIEDKGVDVLLSRPLRELSESELSSYSFSAFKTVGSVQDYLYFLPRIMEFSILIPHWWPEPEITGLAISETRPLEWRQDRLEALQAVLAARIQTALADVECGTDHLDSWLCAASHIGLSVQPFLTQIESSRVHILELYSDNEEALEKGTLANPFWDVPTLDNKSKPPCLGHDQIVAWLKSPVVRRVVYEELGILLPPSE